MKTRLNSLLFALLAGVGTMFATEGALSGLFSVSTDKQIYFSQGNLQYQASTDTWRFAENQYDYVGYESLGNVYADGIKSDNRFISSTYNGWIDLFGWGTGNHPTDTTSNYDNYATFNDWGANKIANGGNTINLWRSLSNDEWYYLFYERQNASTLFGFGSVAGVNGVIILPDNWDSQNGQTFVSCSSKGLTWDGTQYINNSGNVFNHNTYSNEQWQILESLGAVFLPAAGVRDGLLTIYAQGGAGNYWSSSTYDHDFAYLMSFSDDKGLTPQDHNVGRDGGRSVRLVQDKSKASNGGSTPLFPGDPGTLTLNLELKAAVMDGEEIQGYEPTGGGGYAKGNSVTITAQEIPGYEFVQWSDSITDMQRTIVLDQSMTLTAYYTRSLIEIAVAANKWTFICLPPLGDRQYTEDMFIYDGLTDVQWGTYNGAKRAAGQSGWETPEAFNAMQGYIIFSTTAGTLRINAYQDDIRQGESGNTIHAGMIDYASSHAQNANWNFVGNPYPQGYNIAGFAAAGITSPITVWNGTAYTTYTPGIDSYILNPFEAFFIQKAENGAEGITFNPEYLEGADGGNSGSADDGALSGAFSVAAGTQIHFSKGNLQYQASTDTWRFAENQYDMIGNDNANISDSYSGWIDMFGWGTGNNPTNSSTDYNDYSTFVDWGINAISYGGNKANLWRTLTNDEWGYLFYDRPNASGKYGKATVAGVNGIIVLPDDFNGLGINTSRSAWDNNTFSAEDWAAYEADGAVFLPAAGYREGADVSGVGSVGNYWSSTPSSEPSAYNLLLDSNGINPQDAYYRYRGRSVRLVR